jgi:hypothetical protein
MDPDQEASLSTALWRAFHSSMSATQIRKARRLATRLAEREFDLTVALLAALAVGKKERPSREGGRAWTEAASSVRRNKAKAARNPWAEAAIAYLNAEVVPEQTEPFLKWPQGTMDKVQKHLEKKEFKVPDSTLYAFLRSGLRTTLYQRQLRWYKNSS